jgi:hypothetical protein
MLSVNCIFSYKSKNKNKNTLFLENYFNRNIYFINIYNYIRTSGNFLGHRFAEICKISRSRNSAKFFNFAEFRLSENLRRIGFAEFCKIAELRNFFMVQFFAILRAVPIGHVRTGLSVYFLLNHSSFKIVRPEFSCHLRHWPTLS